MPMCPPSVPRQDSSHLNPIDSLGFEGQPTERLRKLEGNGSWRKKAVTTPAQNWGTRTEGSKLRIQMLLLFHHLCACPPYSGQERKATARSSSDHHCHLKITSVPWSTTCHYDASLTASMFTTDNDISQEFFTKTGHQNCIGSY